LTINDKSRAIYLTTLYIYFEVVDYKIKYFSLNLSLVEVGDGILSLKGEKQL